MKKTIVSIMIIVAYTMIMLMGCSGGGGGGGETPAPVQPITAVIRLSVQGTPSASPLGAVQATLHLPAGVTVKATQSAPQTDSGVVTATGEASNAELVLGTYTASSGTVTVSIIKAAGFAVGEFSAINCDIAAGSFPISADFSVSGLSVWDAGTGASVTGLTPTFTATIN